MPVRSTDSSHPSARGSAQAAEHLLPAVGPYDQELQLVFTALFKTDSYAAPSLLRRGYRACADHKIMPARLHAVVFDLLAPMLPMPREPTTSSERRVALGCLLGIQTGLVQSLALTLVDRGRSRTDTDIATYVAKKTSPAAIAAAPQLEQIPEEPRQHAQTDGDVNAYYAQDQQILAGLRGEKVLMMAGPRGPR